MYGTDGSHGASTMVSTVAIAVHNVRSTSLSTHWQYGDEYHLLNDHQHEELVRLAAKGCVTVERAYDPSIV